MSFGSIYSSTNWGNTNNNIGWGKIYESIVSVIKPLASSTRLFADTIRYFASNLFS